MEEFLSWSPSYNRGRLETITRLFWQLVMSWFTLGILYSMSLLDLDKKEKILKKVRNIPWLGSVLNQTIPD
jgi:hypothetical protein